MSGTGIITACLLAALATASYSAGNASNSLISADVMKYGAKANGTTDDTAAFQKALDAAGKKGGVVAVPAGTYLIAGSLNIPQGVTLKGVWEAPHHADIGKGTILYATGGEGNEEGQPFISMHQSTCVRGITIFYPNQDPVNIKPYPWTIRGEGMHNSVIDVTLVNTYKGIDFGTNWNELHYIKNLFGCPLKLGIYINNCTDIGRIEDVHFNPHSWARAAFPNAPSGKAWENLISNYLPNNMVGFLIGKTDWEFMSNCFVIFPKIGYHFIRTGNGDGNVVMTQCGADVCPLAVQVDSVQAHAGVAFENCQFMSAVVVSPTNSGPVKFSNCGFWPIGTTDSQAVIDGTGTVMFTSCHFSDWGKKNPDAPCIKLNSGSMIVNGCDFKTGKNQIELGNGTKSAAIFGCRFESGEHIINNAPATAKVQIGLNIE